MQPKGLALNSLWQSQKNKVDFHPDGYAFYPVNLSLLMDVTKLSARAQFCSLQYRVALPLLSLTDYRLLHRLLSQPNLISISKPLQFSYYPLLSFQTAWSDSCLLPLSLPVHLQQQLSLTFRHAKPLDVSRYPSVGFS